MGAQETGADEGRVSAAELFRLHAPFVARFLFRLGVRPDGIEDAVQEVFLVAHRQGGYRPGSAKPTSYLANLAMHAASAYRRRERVRATRETDAAIEDVASTRRGPVEVLETNESLRRLQDALGRLEPDLRTTLVLAELEGETCTSIAAAMGIPVGTVYWRLHQARKKFQHALHLSDAATRPHRELAVQASGLGGPLRPQRNERGGMLVLLMKSSWMDSEARDLLRLGAERHPVRYAVREGLQRHQHLAGSATPSPSWANGPGTGAKSAAWLAASTTAALAGAALIVLSARGGTPAPARTPPSPASQATMAARMPAPPATTATESPWRPAAMPSSPSSPSPSANSLLATLPWAASPAVALPSTAAPPEKIVVPQDLPPATPRAVAVPAAGTRDSSNSQPLLEPPSAPTAPATPDGMIELREVARAESLLATDPAQALSLARASEARFPQGYVREERAYVELMALLAIGRLDEARPAIARFLRAYPDGAFSRRVREASRRADLEP